MKTTQNTQTYQISISEISPDFDDPTRLEICFELFMTLAYMQTIPAYIDEPENFTDLLENDPINDTDLTYELCIAPHLNNKLYAIIKNDRSGDTSDNLEQAIYAFGQPVIEFITDACKTLNIPFYPNT